MSTNQRPDGAAPKPGGLRPQEGRPRDRGRDCEGTEFRVSVRERRGREPDRGGLKGLAAARLRRRQDGQGHLVGPLAGDAAAAGGQRHRAGAAGGTDPFAGLPENEPLTADGASAEDLRPGDPRDAAGEEDRAGQEVEAIGTGRQARQEELGASASRTNVATRSSSTRRGSPAPTGATSCSCGVGFQAGEGTTSSRTAGTTRPPAWRISRRRRRSPRRPSSG